jgi:hypothetical protein
VSEILEIAAELAVLIFVCCMTAAGEPVRTLASTRAAVGDSSIERACS